MRRSIELPGITHKAPIPAGSLVGNLLGLGQQRLHRAQAQQRVATVALLHGAGDDVTLAARVLLVAELALGLADALGHDLARRLGGDAAEVLGGDVELGPERLALFVDLLRVDPDVDGSGRRDRSAPWPLRACRPRRNLRRPPPW